MLIEFRKKKAESEARVNKIRELREQKLKMKLEREQKEREEKIAKEAAIFKHHHPRSKESGL